MEGEEVMKKFITTISVDEHDVARIELMKKLYDIPTRSAAIRRAIEIAIEQKQVETIEDAL